MPELPEVERFRQLLLPLISKNTLTLTLMKENPPKKFLTSEEVEELSGACFVEEVLRKGKLIAIKLRCRRNIQQQKWLYLFVHMGMTGRISTPDHVPGLESLASSDYPPPYTYLKFATGTAEACFSDPRKFGSIILRTSLEEGFESIAPDALEVDSPDELMGKSTGIKAMLLDQKRIMSGVGNWVADEVLYQSKIHPEQSYLNEMQATIVLQKLKSILNTAIDLYGKDENLPPDWLFHVRWGKRAATNGEIIKDHQGRKIIFLTAAGRTSAIVPEIQKNLKSQKPVKVESIDVKSCLDKRIYVGDNEMTATVEMTTANNFDSFKEEIDEETILGYSKISKKTSRKGNLKKENGSAGKKARTRK